LVGYNIILPNGERFSYCLFLTVMTHFIFNT
jgi:hypothetical protein